VLPCGVRAAGLSGETSTPPAVAEDLLQAKLAAARAAAARIPRGASVALGTGTTTSLALQSLAERFPDGGGLATVASSRATEQLARDLGLPVRSLEEGDRFDLMLDGADEVGPALELTKGGGGALFREKLLARLSREVVIAVDASKLVPTLGSRSPIPVEIVPFARPFLQPHLRSVGFDVSLRKGGEDAPFLTDNGNELLDLRPAQPIADPSALEQRLRSLPGVVEVGIFVGLAHRVIVGFPDGTVQERLAPAAP
jgi:ribose 5-phosphate isomerase A